MAEQASFEALEELMMRQRAGRLFDSREVEDSLIERILGMATRAPSARNAQTWRFIVIRDTETKARLGSVFDELGSQMYGQGAPTRTPWAEVPVLIAVCSEFAFGEDESGRMALGASIYPAVQNLLLAAHAAGLSTVLTTRWKRREPELRPILHLPENVGIYAIIPMGWPAETLGKNRRRPVPEVTYRERWGRNW
ncbi:MAG: nitroreductase family protein [Dehalococcoidia bacterium]|nr:nitroreductase family protein [Dehalococcoidia bacterium]